MLDSMDYFRAIHGAIGCETAKDRKVHEFKTRFARDFDSSINAVYDSTKNGIPQDFIITPTKSGCSLIARPGESFSIGDIIFYNSLHWLVTNVNFHDELTCSGEMVRCNRQIRWQNPKSLEIIERWCLVTKPYTSNIDEGMVLSVSNREFKVQLPYDNETRLLDLDKRFMLEIIDGKPRTYKCTSVDQNTNKYQDIDGGFIVLNLTQDESGQENDNADLMICNYISPGDAPPPSPPSADLLKCEISGRGTIKAGLGSRTYRAVFYMEDGVTEDSSISAVWSVNIPDDMVAHITWEQNGNAISIQAGEAAIGCAILINLIDENGRYAASSMNVEVVSQYE